MATCTYSQPAVAARRPSASVAARCSAGAAAGDALARRRPDPPELLDVDVDQLAGPLALVALAGSRPEPAEACPSRSASGSPTPSTAASRAPRRSPGPVIRNRRNAAIASIRRSSVRLATARRRERSSRPALPSARYRATHFAQVRSLHSGRLGRRRERPAAARPRAAPSARAVSMTERRVSVQLHPVSSLGLGRFAALSLQGGPDEQRAQELQLGHVSPRARCGRGTGGS